jgi:hypothetical protein
MLKRNSVVAALPSLVLATLTMGSIVVSAATYGDDTPAPSGPVPADGGRHGPAWAVCKKQADDQKLAPGEARHEFMRSCMKAAKSAPPPAAGQ